MPSKNIPRGYLTTLPYNFRNEEITTTKGFEDFDHEAAGSNDNLVEVDNNSLEYTTNLESTTEFETTEAYGLMQLVNDTKKSWEEAEVEEKTSEKVFVVTPLPKAMTSLKDIIKALKAEIVTSSTERSLRNVYGEWPHLSKF